MEVSSNSSGFTSIIANSKYANVNIPPQIDYVVDTIANAGPWTLLLTLFLMCVVYDQCAYSVEIPFFSRHRNRNR